ncbi:MAG: META domain-containing protein [Beijerinckiaceae bacterium]
MRMITLAFLVSLAATGAAMAQSDLTGSAWLAEDIMGRGVVDRAQSTLQPLPDGRVAGSSGCNRFNGKGAVSHGKVEIGPLATTRMACPPALMDQETRYLKALAASRRYDIREDGLLRFYDETGALTIRFSRLK